MIWARIALDERKDRNPKSKRVISEMQKIVRQLA